MADDSCLGGQFAHKNILTMGFSFVNDIYQAKNVSIVLGDLSDKQI